MAESKELLPVESRQLITDALYFCKNVAEITINTAQEYENAAELTKKVQNYTQNLDNDRKKLVNPFNNTVKEINKAYKTPLDALENIRQRLRNAVSDYSTRLEQERAEKQRIADEEVRKEKERLLKESGKEGQEDLKEVAETIKTPVVKAEEAPEVPGMHFRKYWTAEVIDKKAFIEYCLKAVKFEYIRIDTSTLNKLAQATQGGLDFPGIKINFRKEPIYKK